MSEELKTLLGESAERQGFLESLRDRLTPAEFERIRGLFELSGQLLALLETKTLSIARLRQLCFGATTESARNVCGKPPREPERTKAKGHGRNSHQSYTGARRVRVKHASLAAGQRCPQCDKGKLRPQQEPAVAITVSAQPPVGAVIHELEQLRCDTCGNAERTRSTVCRRRSGLRSLGRQPPSGSRCPGPGPPPASSGARSPVRDP